MDSSIWIMGGLTFSVGSLEGDRVGSTTGASLRVMVFFPPFSIAAMISSSFSICSVDVFSSSGGSMLLQ